MDFQPSWEFAFDSKITYHEALTPAGCGRYDCEIMRFSSIVEGLDPHGKVQAGYIELRSWAGTASVATLYEEYIGERRTVCVVEQSEKPVEGKVCQPRRQALHIDISLRSGAPNPLETRVGDGVLLLLLECIKQPNYRRQVCNLKALVLRRSQTVSGAYERIGLIRTKPGWHERLANALYTGLEIADGNMFYWPTA